MEIENKDWATIYTKTKDGKKIKRYFLTTRHKIRLFMGLNGQLPSGKYVYAAPKWGNLWLQKKMHKFMHVIGNPILNFVLGSPKLE